MTVATEPSSETMTVSEAVAHILARLDSIERTQRRVDALLDAVDRHPVARRWLGLP